MTDSYRYKGLRLQLVNTIHQKGIADKRILEVIGRVPRHLFVENFLQPRAYEDNALPIGEGQTISQPYTVAFQTELLQVKKGDKILEIGTGSGYQTAVLLELGAKVYSIERQQKLFIKTQALLLSLGYSAHLFYGDGYEGKPTYGPYDKILITAGAPEIPEKLLSQLRVGGMLVAPIGNEYNQVMTSVVKTSDNTYETLTYGDFIFVPMLKGVAK